jgi:hypothetical protein
VGAPGPALQAAAAIEGNVQRLLVRESTFVATAAERAGHLPELAALVTSSLGEPAFRDALASEPWWKDFRLYGCVALVGDGVKVAWLPPSGMTPAELARALGPDAAHPAGGARVVLRPEGIVLGALAPIEGVKGARVMLAEALDRRKVAVLAARANVVMMLSDGRKDLGASVPDTIVPLVETLVGKESSHVLIERHLGQVAVAVPWVDGLWLWVVTGWTP